MSPEDRDEACEKCRARAFDYRRGDLESGEQARIEAHLDGCEACRDFVDRIDILIESTRESDPVPEPADPDAMFDAIADRIEAPGGPEAGGEPEGGGGVEWGPRGRMSFRRSVAVAAAAAVAGLLLGAAVTSIWIGSGEAPRVASEPEPDERDDSARGSKRSAGERARAEGDERDEGAGSEPDGEEAQTAGFAELREVGHEQQAAEKGGEAGGEGDSEPGTGEELPEGVRLFASSEADWEVDTDDGPVLSLDRGRMLVEYRSRGGESLRVRAPGCEVRVVGTVFYVSAERDEPRVGVLAGGVEVEPEGSESVRLEADREVTASFEPREISEERRRTLSGYVDLQAHRRALRRAERSERAGGERASDGSDPAAERRAQRGREPGGDESDAEPAPAAADEGADRPGAGEASEPAAEPDRPAEADEAPERRSGEPPPREIRGRADRAVADGEPRRAEKLYREFLERTSPAHPGAGQVRLDLAKLYSEHLDEPRKAVEHLRTFVRRWPDDVAAPAARDELCQLTRRLEGFAPDCR